MFKVFSFLLVCLIITSLLFNRSSMSLHAVSNDELSFAFSEEVNASELNADEMDNIEGQAAPLIAVVALTAAGKMIVKRWVSTRVAGSIVKQGGSVWAPNRQTAQALARQSSSGKPIREFHAGSGERFTHYHTDPRNGSHVWYGSPRTYGFAAGVAWGRFYGDGFDPNFIEST